MLDLLKQEPERLLDGGTEAGHEWIVAHNNLGFRNGYVKVPPGHPWHVGTRAPDWEQFIDVHGGVTYADEDTNGQDWWIGFDTAHADDGQDLTLPFEADLTFSFNGHIWTLEEVAEECRRVCRQAASAAWIDQVPDAPSHG